MKLNITENMMYTINCINNLHNNAGSDYYINIEDFETIESLKNECKLVISELWHEGYLGKNWDMKLFLIDMLK